MSSEQGQAPSAPSFEQLRAELAQVQEKEIEAWKARTAALGSFKDADAVWSGLARRSRELQEEIQKLGV